MKLASGFRQRCVGVIRGRRMEGHLQVKDEDLAESQPRSSPYKALQTWVHFLYEAGLKIATKARAMEMRFGALRKWVGVCRRRIRGGFFHLGREEDEGGYDGRRIPEEVLVDILLRVHFKTLLRCRCVCKTWGSLISNPYFIKLHLENVNNHIATENEISDYVIFSNKENGSETINFHSSCGFLTRKLNFPHQLWHNVPFVGGHIPLPCSPMNFIHRHELKVVGSCNGLLCLFSNDYAILWNPAINRVRIVEVPETKLQLELGGICFIPQTSDFKVVVLEHNHGCEPANALIYSAETNSWKEAARNNSVCWSIRIKFSAANVEGALHWCAFKDYWKQVILCFDVFDESFREIAVPARKLLLKRIVEFRGTIACFLADISDTSWELWVMKEYSVAASWTKLYAFRYLDGIPLQIMNNGEVMLTSADGDGDFFLFNPTTQNHGMDVEAKPGCHDMVAYKGSLALLNDNNPSSRNCWFCVFWKAWFCVAFFLLFVRFSIELIKHMKLN